MPTRRTVLQGASCLLVTHTTWPTLAASAATAAPTGPASDLLVHSKLPLNAETPIAKLRSSFVTPQAEFYIRDHGTVPKIEEAGYRLKIGGKVKMPIDLSLSDLKSRFPERKVMAVMQCAGNRRADMVDVGYVEGDLWGPGAIGNAEWTGVSLSDVLSAAGAEGGTGLHVAFFAHDEVVMKDDRFDYGVSIPLEKAMTPDVLLAWAMNGEPLMAEHGFPLRVVVPGYAGTRSPKWLASIMVQDEEADTPIQRKEYRLFPPTTTKETADKDPNVVINDMPLNAAICIPAAGATLKPGTTKIEGYAIGTQNGVAKVEVSYDGGENWHEAAIDRRADTQWAWVFWSVVLDLPIGQHQLAVRSFDEAGGSQPGDIAKIWNWKGYLAHSWHRVPVSVG